MFMFDVHDPITGKRASESEATIADLKRRLRANDVHMLKFCGFDHRTHVLDWSDPASNTVALWTTTSYGSERREKWTFSKFENYLEGGLIGVRGGELHQKWIESSKPKPLDPEAAAWLAEHVPMPFAHMPAQSAVSWELHATADAGDRTIHIWRSTLDDGNELLRPTIGQVPKGRIGWRNLDELIEECGYDALDFKFELKPVVQGSSIAP